MIKSKVTSIAAALLCSVALVGALSACSDDDKDSKSGTTSAAAATSAGAKTSGTETSAAAAAGKSSVKVDGVAWEGEFSSSCVKTGDTTALAIYDKTGDARKGGGATISGTDTVVSVGLGEATSGLGYTAGAPGGSAKVAKEGNTFTVSGEALGADLQNPTQPKKSTFEIVFACETVTGG